MPQGPINRRSLNPAWPFWVKGPQVSIAVPSEIAMIASMAGAGSITSVTHAEMAVQSILAAIGAITTPMTPDSPISTTVGGRGSTTDALITDAQGASSMAGIGGTTPTLNSLMQIASALQGVGRMTGDFPSNVFVAVLAVLSAVGVTTPAASVNAVVASAVAGRASNVPVLAVEAEMRTATAGVGRTTIVPVVDATLGSTPAAVGRTTVSVQSIMALIAAAAGRGIVSSLASLDGLAVHPDINLPTPLSLKPDDAALAVAAASADLLLRTDAVVLSISDSQGVLALRDTTSGTLLATGDTFLTLKPETTSIEIDG